MLEQIKLLLGISDDSKDDLLTALIAYAQEEIRNYCHRDDIEALESTLIQMVIYRYNLIGSEGLKSENYSGVQYVYETNYPAPILAQLNSKRKVMTL